MTLRSVNEIETTLRKAAIGAGLPLGLAEDAGRSGAWLAATGADGVGLCVDALEQLVADPVGFDDRSGKLVVDRPANGLQFGPAAADILCARTVMNKSSDLTALSVSQPLLCVPPIAETARAMNLTVKISFADQSLVCSPDGVMLVEDWPVLGVFSPVIITPDSIGARSVENVVGRYQQSLEKGIDVDDSVWARVLTFAARIMVAASESSRQAGAGAGAIDNE